jgi:hypothetical protein
MDKVPEDKERKILIRRDSVIEDEVLDPVSEIKTSTELNVSKEEREPNPKFVVTFN